MLIPSFKMFVKGRIFQGIKHGRRRVIDEDGHKWTKPKMGGNVIRRTVYDHDDDHIYPCFSTHPVFRTRLRTHGQCVYLIRVIGNRLPRVRRCEDLSVRGAIYEEVNLVTPGS